ncbi:hypothetical protein CKO28_07870 [Rhodovibrio sodomensis]|uniref:Probable inorganic carbon transporter subunit DabA n=1 Tax=Rhodovibrio sodomensis TaxID=1088 RepID=A0ABS1DBW6_9PROT|nr:DUF2309 domain-containing protein [Rhodovibrio sodomensis]MBK1667951.1 hypothetical protein [Rhodovibrio sodomensis]
MPDRARLSALIANASETLAPYWPLRSFIAVNPLQGLEHLPFEQAVAEGAARFGGRGYPSDRLAAQALAQGRIDRAVLAEVARGLGRPDLAEGPPPAAAPQTPAQPAAQAARPSPVDRELIKALAAFLDDGQAVWPMPDRHLGFFAAWRRIARHDPALPGRAFIQTLPADPVMALLQLLDGVPAAQIEDRLAAHLLALPGWSSYVKWRADNPVPEAPIMLADLLAVRLTLAHLFAAAPPKLPAAAANAVPDGRVWLEAWEETYRRDLTAILAARAERAGDTDRAAAPAPEAQLVFCIDVRSEVLRRHLEAQGPYETLGFAGFFGAPVAFAPFDEAAPHASCPVLLTPRHTIPEVPAVDAGELAERARAGMVFKRGLKQTAQALKASVAGAFAFVEATGAVYGAAMAGRTIAPRGFQALADAVSRAIQPPAPTETKVDLSPCGDGHTAEDAEYATGLSPSEQAFFAETALTVMGLTDGFAPLVVLCGHGGETRNNPFAAGLDCGACGGHAGGPNARIMAAILNKPEIREKLANRGIRIPEPTLFLAAEHNTTTDAVALFDTAAAQARHADKLARLLSALAAAGRGAAHERARHLPGDAPSSRAADWAQVRPEWALARNAGFIVGHRDLTRALNLDGRCFLHSYDWRNDGEGKALEVILTAPMVVAQWINSQYYFSTLDPVAYGAGSKVTHNVVGGVGVMQGNASDLMTGLPLQSTWQDAETPQHEPLRLLTAVHAPVERIEAVIQRNDVLKTLFGNGWVALLALDPERGSSLRRTRAGDWIPADPPRSAAGDGDNPAEPAVLETT